MCLKMGCIFTVVYNIEIIFMEESVMPEVRLPFKNKDHEIKKLLNKVFYCLNQIFICSFHDLFA